MDSGRKLPKLGRRNRPRARKAASSPRRVDYRLEPRTHGGIAAGGRCGGVPPHKGGPERPDRPERQWSVVSGQELLGPVSAGRTRDRLVTVTHGRIVHACVGDALESRTHGGITSRSLTRQLGTRTHGGIASGGAAGGVPPHKGGPKARLSKRQWPVAGNCRDRPRLRCSPRHRNLHARFRLHAMTPLSGAKSVLW